MKAIKISQAQAHTWAVIIAEDIKAYIETHTAAFAEFEKKEKPHNDNSAAQSPHISKKLQSDNSALSVATR